MSPSFGSLSRHLFWSFIPALLVNAVPVEQRAVTVGVTSAQLSKLVLLSQYSAAAYCFSNVHETGAAINCAAESGSCPLVEAAGVTILLAFNEVGDSDTAGYVAVDDTNKLLVVGIQGTAVSSNPEAILTDIDIIRDDTTLCGTANTNDGCEVHSGFYEAMVDIQTIVKNALTTAKVKYPGYQIATTGHSLGGAVAALLGTWLRNEGEIVDIYTYGQPHLGTVDISNYIQSQSPAQGINYRVTHANDVVPQLPEHSLGDWDHYYPEFWIDVDDNTATVAITTANIDVVTGSLFVEDGNEGQRSGLTWIGDIIEGAPAHKDYFGLISACISDEP